MEYAVEICNAVLDVCKPTPEKKVIINLPSTVEMATPNVYADQIEYVCEHIHDRDSVIISLHAHNDRGCAVASSELGLMAGADRVEGTLFGNGERTGNADIMNIAMNMFSQGIDPKLNFDNIEEVVQMYEKSTGLFVHPRHPYAGKLVYTAFSGSHQDAIKKGMARGKEHPEYWEVPYLPIDPADVGRSYDPIIRINSQSGKGGVAYILEQNFGLILPKNLQKDFGPMVTKVSDTNNKELLPQELYDLFMKEYVNRTEPLKLLHYSEAIRGTDQSSIEAEMLYSGRNVTIHGEGNGIISAFCKAIEGLLGIDVEVVNYSEHSLEYGSKSRAITYIQMRCDGKDYYGAGISSNITKSSLRAIVTAINKILKA